MPEEKDLIPNEEATNMTESGPNTPVEIASAKALHDQKSKVDSPIFSDEKSEVTSEDFVKFDMDAVKDLKNSKDTH